LGRGARLSWCWIVCRRFYSRWKRLATCWARGAPWRAPSAWRPQRSIPADDLNTGMLTQPPAGCRGRPVGQHVEDLAPFEVDHDRPVTKPLLPSPVINPDHPHRRCFVACTDMALETAQNRVIALWQSQACHRALRRTAARDMAEKPGQIGHPAGPSGIRAGDIGKAIAERPTFAALVLASPS
jgi:hypothetical protein